MKFTKLYDKERELLRKTNSVASYEVYMHLKNDYSYYKGDCYDLTKCISQYLDIPERTVKDAIKRLKEVGLISTTLRGKVSIYQFPILSQIENGDVIIQQEDNNKNIQEVKEAPKTIIDNFISDEEIYGKRVVDFFVGDDDRYSIIKNILYTYTEGVYLGDASKKEFGEIGKKKLAQMAIDYGFEQNTEEWENVTKYAFNIIREYYIQKTTANENYDEVA